MSKKENEVDESQLSLSTEDASDGLVRYWELEDQLCECRRSNELGSEEERPILAEMEDVWCNDLSEEDKRQLDSVGPSRCFPCYYTDPFSGAVAGKNLFYIPGINRYVLVEASEGPRFSVHFLAKIDSRSTVAGVPLPLPTALHLAEHYVSSLQGHSSFRTKTRYGAEFVADKTLIFEKPLGQSAEFLLREVAKNPYFFAPSYGDDDV